MEAVEYLRHWHKVDKNKLLRCEKHQKRLKKCAEFMIGERFADVGCAEGHSTNIMKKFKPGYWTGIDFCRDTIEIARNKFKDIGFHYSESIALLTYIEPKFDSVVCSEVIEHVENDEHLVYCLMEMTKYNLIITTPCIKVISVGHLRTYNDEMLRRLFHRIDGVKIEKNHPFYYIYIQKNGDSKCN